MDVGAIEAAVVGAKTAEIQLAIAAKMLRMSADAAASAGKIIDAAQANMDSLANVAAGIGANLDISV